MNKVLEADYSQNQQVDNITNIAAEEKVIKKAVSEEDIHRIQKAYLLSKAVPLAAGSQIEASRLAKRARHEEALIMSTLERYATVMEAPTFKITIPRIAEQQEDEFKCISRIEESKVELCELRYARKKSNHTIVQEGDNEIEALLSMYADIYFATNTDGLFFTNRARHSAAESLGSLTPATSYWVNLDYEQEDLMSRLLDVLYTTMSQLDAEKKPLTPVWVMSPSIWAALQKIKDESGRTVLFKADGTLFGVPVITHAGCEELDAKILLGDFSRVQVWIIKDAFQVAGTDGKIEECRRQGVAITIKKDAFAGISIANMAEEPSFPVMKSTKAALPKITTPTGR